MLDSVRQTILYDQNAIYYGYPIEKLMERAGVGIAKVLLKKYGTNKKRKKIGFFCGPGNNGGDGFAAARYLKGKAEVEVYLIPSSEEINTFESKKNWRLFNGKKYENIKAKDIPNDFDVVVECLFGTGLKGKVREPYASVIKKLNRLKGKKVTIDIPAPGFKTNFSISMMFPKMPNAAVVDIGFPENIASQTGVGEVKVLQKPAATSHKGDNGQVLVIGGSQYFHGAPVLASQAASKIVDLVYFSSTAQNNEVVKKMKAKLADFMVVPRIGLEKIIKKVDVILIGPGLGVTEEGRKITNSLLKKYKNKKIVIDADALKMVDKKLLNKNCIVTPHRQEFKILFGVTGSEQTVKKMAKKYKCTIVLKGSIDFISTADEFKFNRTGNVSMTKGGTGDVLAGLIAGLAATNELFLAASAGAFINGLAGDRLNKRVSHYYNASDLVKEIPNTIKWALDY